MKYKVSVIKKIAFLVMTMALAVAMVACQGAVGTAGKDGKDAPGIEPQVVNGGIPDTEVDVGKSKRMDVSGHFNDPDGDNAIITYSPATSDAEFATAEISGKTVTVMGIKEGMAIITVTATDAQGLTAKSSFKVTVNQMPEPEPDPEPESTPEEILEMVSSSITLDEDMLSDDVTLPAEYTLDAGEDGVVTVMRKSMEAASSRWTSTDGMTENVWVITAQKMGETTVEVLDADGVSVKEIMVSSTYDAPLKATPIGAMTLRLGEPAKKITLSSYFMDPEGETINYEVGSSAPTFVEPMVADGVLTLEGKSVGSAEISVTATVGEDMQTISFMVTVDASCKTEYPLKIGGTASCELPSGYYYYIPDGMTVRVDQQGTTLTIVALKKGEATITILNDRGLQSQLINVQVMDPPPERNTEKDPEAPSLVVADSNGRNLYELNLSGPADMLHTYFEDDEPTKLKFTADAPPQILIRMKDGYVDLADDKVLLEVLSLPKTVTFQIKFYAEDSENKAERPVVFTFITGVVPPGVDQVRDDIETYDYGQYTNGTTEKSTIMIGNRLGTKHVLTVSAAEAESVTEDRNKGFRFAANLISDNEHRIFLTNGSHPHVTEKTDIDGSDLYTKPDTDPPAVTGVDYWKVEASGSIRMDTNKVVFVASDGIEIAPNGPESNSIGFQVIPVGTGPGKITVTYYVWVAKPGEEPVQETLGGLWIHDDLVLNVDVVPCTGFEMCDKL